MVKTTKYIIVTGLVFIGFSVALKLSKKSQTSGDLIVYSYSSFSATWGPGPILKKIFEEKCRCKIQIRDAEDSRLLIQRLKLEGERVGADVVVGLNQWDIDSALKELRFEPLRWTNDSSLKLMDDSLKRQGALFPFDWGILAFNTKLSSPVVGVKNFDDLIKFLPDQSLALQDPRTSAPGLSFLIWIVQVMGEEKAFSFLQKLSPKILTIASGWSSSYGLFQKGQAKAVFSYVTSPLYHQIEEQDLNYLALPFAEGQPIHIEYAGVLSTCRECDKAQTFTKFLLSPEAQTILMKKNYMLPIDRRIAEKTPWDIANNFKRLELPKISLADQQQIIQRWTQWVRER